MTISNWKELFEVLGAGFKLHAIADKSREKADKFNLETVGLEVRAVRILRIIDGQPGITFGELVEITQGERSLVSRLLQILVRSGHITRKISESDARRFELYSTEQGARTSALAKEFVSATLEVFLAPLSPEQAQEFDRALTLLGHWIETPEFNERLERIAAAVKDKRQAQDEKQAAPKKSRKRASG